MDAINPRSASLPSIFIFVRRWGSIGSPEAAPAELSSEERVADRPCSGKRMEERGVLEKETANLRERDIEKFRTLDSSENTS